MRRIVSVILVAVVAFAVGVGAREPLSRWLADPRVAAPPTATATAAPPSSPTPDAPTASPTAAATATAMSTSSPTPTPRASLAAPLSLDQRKPGGSALPAGGWTGAAGTDLQVTAPVTRTLLRAEVEVRPSGQRFSGRPTDVTLVHDGVASIAVRGLASGRYHWQARLASDAAVSRWYPFARGGAAFAFAVLRRGPAAPVIASPTNPKPGAVYATSTISFTWTAPADPAGIAGYSYRLDTDPHGYARPRVRTLAQQIALTGLGSGAYYFHARALDAAGNWGATATYPVHIDVTPPVLLSRAFSGYYINPALESLHLAYSLSKVAHVTVGIYNAAGDRIRHLVFPGLLPAKTPLKVAWNGRDDSGKLAPAGVYSFYMRTVDRLGNAHVVGWGGFNVTYKRIVVSLAQQRLWAYDGPTPVLSSLVTTGNRLLPTPTGLFHVMFARHPFTFHSPWPKGSPYYYPPSPVNYALYFKDSGYYIHDAPWRSQFGPGTNAVIGTPGQNLTGTHGCINVPEATMQQLYAWATPGTPVEIGK